MEYVPAFATYIEIHELWPLDLLTFLLALSLSLFKTLY